VPADRGDRDAVALDRELDTLVGLMVDEPAVGEALDGRGDRARRQAQPFGQDPGVGAAVLGQAIDRLQGLAIAFRQGCELVFDG
jgi:hypothetical protein